MKTVKLDGLKKTSVPDLVRAYAEKIPNGEAVRVRDAIQDLGLSHHSQVFENAPDLVIYRYIKNRRNGLLVNPRTAAKLKESDG